MRTDKVWKGKRVRFTGKQCSYANLFAYEKIFGDSIYIVLGTRSDCCNVYLILDGIDGAYNSKMFEQIPPAPP